jgi:hypothetical protein
MRLLAVLLLSVLAAGAQPKDANYDEAKVPKYKLPNPLILKDGRPVKDAPTWTNQRRPELLELFRTEMYGRRPGKPAHMIFEPTSIDRQALGGKAIRKEVTIYLTGEKDGPQMNLLLYLPAAATKPVPVFLGLNFGPNQTVDKDPGITLRDAWARVPNSKILVRKPANEDSRGAAASRWQVDMILSAGYGLAVIYYCDIEPDFDGGMSSGVRPAFFQSGPDGGAAIAAWAWGLSRALDYLETDRQVNARQVAVFGHSRLGKTSLWAGAEDTRFAMVISNCSGEGGAALSRREFGEQPRHLNRSFPHWFDANYKKYSDNVTGLPFDQHELIALIAPRPVYVATAEEDAWSDPKGQFLAEVAAGPVYELLGKQSLGTDRWPDIHQPILRDMGYHHRAGKHDVTAYDWEQYLKFAAMHFKP